MILVSIVKKYFPHEVFPPWCRKQVNCQVNKLPAEGKDEADRNDAGDWKRQWSMVERDTGFYILAISILFSTDSTPLTAKAVRSAADLSQGTCTAPVNRTFPGS